MRYIGCKNNLLPHIEDVVRGAGCQAGVFCDIFAGTHSVAAHFKRLGFQIVSNDLLFLAYIFGRALIKNNSKPTFARLAGSLASDRKSALSEPGDPYLKTLNHLNHLRGVPDGFVFNAYCPNGNNEYKRQYLSDQNGQKIDAVRQRIEEWRQAELITEDEYYLLLLSLLKAVSRVANISGTYGAYLKDWDPRTRKPLILEPISIIASEKEHHVHQQDANELIEEIKCAVLYIDPPYNTRQYITNYHLLETIARYDRPEIYGKTGLRPYTDDEKSSYCSKTVCLDAFTDLIQKAQAEHIVVSYSSEGIMAADEILDVLQQRGETKLIAPIEYQRFKSHSNGVSKNTVQEYLFHVQTKQKR